MTHTHKGLSFSLTGLALLSALIPSGRIAPAAPAGTAVCGVISASATWILANSPYIICDTGARVVAGATLTIEPGVIIQSGAYATFQVDGSLSAIGSAAQPILFTNAAKTPGGWMGLAVGSYISPNASAALSNVIVEYGGGANGDNVSVFRSSLVVSDTIIRNSGKNGLNIGAGSRLRSKNLQLTGNGAGAQGYPLLLGNLDVEDAVFSGLFISGNGINEVALTGGALSMSQTWENLGVPYRVIGSKSVPAGGKLVVQPGVELRFEPYTSLDVLGALDASGLPGQPITFTSPTKTPGAWWGVNVTGDLFGGYEAAAQMDHVVIEYGGALFANVYVSRARVSARNSIIRNSANDGIRVMSVSALNLESSQIMDNLAYAVNGDWLADAVIASNNWWGATSGPQVDGNCNPGGAGGKLTQAVIYQPYLTAPNQQISPLAPSNAAQLTLTPERWFEPLNSYPGVRLAATLRDGNGNPLIGRPIHFSASLGGISGDVVTDVNGNAFANVSSPDAGDADITAQLVGNQCEAGRNAKTRITFVAQNDRARLTGDEQAPYLSGSVQINPQPIVQGAPTRLSISITNPYTEPIIVNGTWGWAGSGIGLVFHPITGSSTTIGAGVTGTISVVWTPLVSGNYCVLFDYDFHKASEPPWDPHFPPPPNRKGYAGQNLSILSGSFKQQQTHGLIDTAKLMYQIMDDVGFALEFIAAPEAFPLLMFGNQITGNIADFVFDNFGAAACLEGGGSGCGGWNGLSFQYPGGYLGNIQVDPPNQDYKTIQPLDMLPFTPAVAAPGVPAARAEALNTLVTAQISTTLRLQAAVVAYDRYSGAVEAGEDYWANQQANAYLHYLGEAATWMTRTSDAMDAFVTELNAEGITDLHPSLTAFNAYKQRLQTQGFNAQEIAAARMAGLTDDAIEAIRQRRLSMAMSDLNPSFVDGLKKFSAAHRALGQNIAQLPAFGVAYGAAQNKMQTDTRLVKIYDTAAQIQVGNPFTQTATISLTIRRIDLPPDWGAIVSPVTSTLAPGERITATITLLPGASAVQNSKARVGVEGYITDQLLGGVAVDMFAPAYLPSGANRIYLPLMRR